MLDSIPQRPDVQVLVVEDPEGRGGGYARNQALPQAIGRWLLFADADDFYAEGFLDVLDAYANRTDLDVVYFGFRMLAADTLTPEPIITADYIQAFDGSQQAEERIRFGINSPWCKMIRSSLVADNDIRFDETRIANDRFFSLQVGHFAQRIAVEKRVLYNYLHYPASQTNRQWNRAKVRDLLQVTLRSNAFLRSIGHPELCRRLPNLWLEALREGGFRRFWLLTQAYLTLNFWSSERKQACLICRVATKVNEVNILNSLVSKPVRFFLENLVLPRINWDYLEGKTTHWLILTNRIKKKVNN